MWGCKKYWGVDMNKNKDLKYPYCGKPYLEALFSRKKQR
jgi:hypothetical protein